LRCTASPVATAAPTCMEEFVAAARWATAAHRRHGAARMRDTGKLDYPDLLRRKTPG
jgi:hypothetical protein